MVKSILQKCPAVQRRAAGRELSLSEVDDAEDQTSDEADDGNTPLPAEAVLDVVLDLDTGQTDLGIGLAGVEIKDHIKYCFGWQWGVSIICLVAGLILGVIHF